MAALQGAAILLYGLQNSDNNRSKLLSVNR